MDSVDSLRAGCAQVGQVVDDLRLDCEACISRLDDFDTWVTNWMWLTLAAKLQILLLYIETWRRLLQEQHGDQGEIAVFMKANQGISLQWVHDPRLVANRGSFTKYGFTVMTCEEASTFILRKINDDLPDNWLPVLEWFNAYAKGPGLDIAQYMHMWGWPW